MVIVWDQAMLKFITIGKKQQLACSIVLLYFCCSNKKQMWMNYCSFYSYESNISIAKLVSIILIVSSTLVQDPGIKLFIENLKTYNKICNFRINDVYACYVLLPL